jgi:hypothetical protein
LAKTLIQSGFEAKKGIFILKYPVEKRWYFFNFKIQTVKKLTDMATKKVYRLRPLQDWLLTDEEWWDQA